ANDPRRRTFTSAIEADAQPLDFARLAEELERHGSPGAQGLLALAQQFGGLLDKFGGGIAMGPGGPVRMGGEAQPLQLAAPPTAEALGLAEARIGRAIPQELRQLYAIGDGGFGHGRGLLPLAQLVKRYLEYTEEPFGPAGQEWPANLLPVFDEERVIVSLDLECGAIIVWNPEEIEDEDSEEDWQRSFRREYTSLAECMDAWLASPIFVR
ncbi:MAG: SMI1/KNR4 family protein, partial [Novosphingobium sp.]|nr:SMI1/KNR4 family protein [Novosphingobium sp.]